MGAAETILRRVLEHPKRRWIVISVTLVTGLLTLWPTADDYFAARAMQDELRTSLDEAEEELAHLDALKKTAEETQKTLQGLENRTIPTGGIQKFRDELVDTARRAGCRLEGFDMAEPVRRPWRNGDSPFIPPAVGDKKQETPFEFTSQSVVLKLAGPVENLREFLTQLEKIERFAHISGMQFRPEEPERKEVALELNLQLFSLDRKKAA